LVHIADVTGVKPAVPHDLRSCLGVTDIFDETLAITHDDLALLAGFYDHTGLGIADHHFDAGHGPPGTGERSAGIERIHFGQRTESLAHTKAVTKHLAPTGDDVTRPAGGAITEDDLDAGERGAFRLARRFGH